MATVVPRPIVTPPHPPSRRRGGSVLVHVLRTTDPKDIAVLYLVTSSSSAPTGGEVAAQGTGGEHISGSDPRNR